MTSVRCLGPIHKSTFAPSLIRALAISLWLYDIEYLALATGLWLSDMARRCFMDSIDGNGQAAGSCGMMAVLFTVRIQPMGYTDLQAISPPSQSHSFFLPNAFLLVCWCKWA